MSGGMGREWRSDHDAASEALPRETGSQQIGVIYSRRRHSFTLDRPIPSTWFIHFGLFCRVTPAGTGKSSPILTYTIIGGTLGMPG